MKEAARKRSSSRKPEGVQAAARRDESEVASTSLIAGIFARRYGAEPEAQAMPGSVGEPEEAKKRRPRR